VTELSIEAKRYQEEMEKEKEEFYRRLRISSDRPSSGSGRLPGDSQRRSSKMPAVSKSPTEVQSSDSDSEPEIEGFGMVVPKKVKVKVVRADRRKQLGLPATLNVGRRRYSWEQ
jgi:hypothetical protein